MQSCQSELTLYNGVQIPCLGLGTYQSKDAVAFLRRESRYIHGLPPH